MFAVYLLPVRCEAAARFRVVVSWQTNAQTPHQNCTTAVFAHPTARQLAIGASLRVPSASPQPGQKHDIAIVATRCP